MEKETNTKMRAIICRAGEPAAVEEIESGLASLQHLVDGYIECVYPFDDDVCIICNEEGKITELPLNRALYDDNADIYDVIAGTFLLVGLTEDSFRSLTDAEVEKFEKLFRYPEIFVSVNGKIRAFPVHD